MSVKITKEMSEGSVNVTASLLSPSHLTINENIGVMSFPNWREPSAVCFHAPGNLFSEDKCKMKIG